jgi:hypothetical protein
MNLKKLSDSTLLDQTLHLVQRERELLSDILHHLREIERRRLFSELGCKSLFEYATKKLGYADDQAGRRISTMRLLKELPEIEEKISDGSLTLTNLSMAQTLFRQEQKISGFSKEKKLQLLVSLENKSKREAEKIIISNSSQPEVLKPDRIRSLTDRTVEIKFSAPIELEDKIEKVKGLLAHSNPNVSMAEMIDYMCELTINKLDPGQKRERKKKHMTEVAAKPAVSEPTAKPAPVGQAAALKSKSPAPARLSPCETNSLATSAGKMSELWLTACPRDRSH